MTKPKTVKLTAGDRTFYICINTFLIFIGIVIAIPMWSTITLSFRPNTFIGSNLEGMFLPIWKWDISAYKALLGNDGFITAFWNSMKIMVFGVVTALFLTVPMAYCMSVNDLPGRKILNYFL